MRTITAADLFCGAGGASTALRRACSALGLGVDLLAINHWPTAIETHSSNHSDARHMCASIEQVDPRVVIPGGRLNLLLAAPECTNHSRARGGRPIHDQSRTTAWSIPKWAQEVYIDQILIENVEEFLLWGPLGVNGRPMKRLEGATFDAFVVALRSLDYRVEWRVLNAADYGDATTRRRLFIQARRSRGPIRWPLPTHARGGQASLFGARERWRPAREVIDWSIRGESIFNRRRPLKPKTLDRIFEGLRRFGGERLAPFVMHLTHGGRAHSLEKPLPTVTAAHRGELALVQPFVLQQQSGGAPRGVDQPLPAIATAGAQALVQPFLVPLYNERAGQRPRTHSIDEPLPTVMATAAKFCLAQPFLTSYYSTGGVTPVTDPVPTITTRDRFALVQPVVGDQALDVHFRMLRPHELAAAMSFPEDYRFAGSGADQVRQIGNAWPVRLGQALIETMLGGAG